MPKNREFELKLSIAPGEADRVARHPALGGAVVARRDRLVSTYYDTADGALRRRRVALRIRSGGRGTVQTLKASGASLVERGEWERAGGDRPDLAWLRTTPLAALFAEKAVSRGLDARFTVDVERTLLPILYDGTQIEGAIDEGAIRSGGLVVPVHEVELEHKGGPMEGVVALARRLAHDIPLVLSLASKAERGFAVAEADWGRPSKTIPLDLAGAREAAPLFAGVLQACLHALCRNAALIGGLEDEEAVHTTRIALRHIRAALGLFRPILRRKRLRRVRREVKWISDRLGAARDADVFRTMAGAADATGALAGALEPRRRRAHARLEAALASARWRLLLIDLLAFSLDGVRRSRRDRDGARFARRRLHKLGRGLARDARSMTTLSPDALHDLRKRAKMLRYDLDLVGDVPKLRLGRKRLRRSGRALHAMQQTLGTLHDAQALHERLDETILSRRKPPRAVEPADWAVTCRIARQTESDRPDGEALRHAADAARKLRRRGIGSR